jgi:hypothetical protein
VTGNGGGVGVCSVNKSFSTVTVPSKRGNWWGKITKVRMKLT